jgi:hypothetical protein
MKKWICLFALPLLLIITTGCPYESEVPLDNPSVEIPATLPGTWAGLSDSGAVITITPLDRFSFLIQYNTKQEPVKLYTAFLSQIKNVQILNLHPQQPETGLTAPYAFYKFELTNDGTHILLIPVTENIKEKFTSPTRQKKFFKKYILTSFFYDADEELEYEKIKPQK